MLIIEQITPKEAVISDGEGLVRVPAEAVRGCKTGDAVIFSEGRYITDKAATEQRRRDMIRLRDSLWE